MSEVGAAAASRGPDGGLSGSAEDAGDGVAGDGGDGEGLSSGMMKNDPGAGSWTRRPVITATRRLKDRKCDNWKFPKCPFYALFVVIEFENDSHPVQVRLCQAGSRRFGEKTHRIPLSEK